MAGIGGERGVRPVRIPPGHGSPGHQVKLEHHRPSGTGGELRARSLLRRGAGCSSSRAARGVVVPAEADTLIGNAAAFDTEVDGSIVRLDEISAAHDWVGIS